jgi:NAD kinase
VLRDSRRYQLVRQHDAVRQRASDSLPADCEPVIALGGDGTILRALQLAITNHAAVLGINFGNVGFLADNGSDDLAAALRRIARGEAQVEERIALAATVPADPPRRMTAFNDVVVARVPGLGTARLRVDIDGQAMLALAGDGVVIASPTGSTAYTLVPVARRSHRPSRRSSSRRSPARAARCDRSWGRNQRRPHHKGAVERAAEHRGRRPQDRGDPGVRFA